MDTQNKKYTDEELERDIINAVRARGLKEQMQTWEEEAKKGSEQKQTIIHLRPFTKRVIIPLAAAAMLCGLIWTVVPASTWRYGYRQLQREYARLTRKDPASQQQNTNDVLLALAAPSIAEIGERTQNQQALGHNDLLAEAVAEMQLGHYRIAQGLLEDAAGNLSDDDPLYAQTADDADYLSALCSLGRGQRSTAKRKLQAIAASNSRHRSQAADLLKHFN